MRVLLALIAAATAAAECGDDSWWNKNGEVDATGKPKDCSWVRQLAGERCAAKGNNGFAFEACKESCFACGQPCHDGDWKDSEGHDCKYVAKQLSRCALKGMDVSGTTKIDDEPAWAVCRSSCHSCEAGGGGVDDSFPLWLYAQGLVGTYGFEEYGKLDVGFEEIESSIPPHRLEFVATKSIMLYEMYKSKPCDDVTDYPERECVDGYKRYSEMTPCVVTFSGYYSLICVDLHDIGTKPLMPVGWDEETGVVDLMWRTSVETGPKYALEDGGPNKKHHPGVSSGTMRRLK